MAFFAEDGRKQFVLGAALLSEPLGARTLAGTAVILAGVALVQLRAPRR